MSIWIVSIILLVTLYFLLSEKLPIDLVALGIMVVLVVTGILTPVEAIGGFSSPAVITVAAMFLISQGMIRTGVVGYIGQKVITYSRGSERLAMVMVLSVVAVASAFINNTPVVVLFIPIMLSLSCELGFSPSKALIPISYASILAGTCTLIGTSTNIIISDLSDQYGFGTLTMFELLPVGLPIAIVGILFILLAAPKLMPAHHNPVCELGNGSQRRYLAEIYIPRGSRFIGEDPERCFSEIVPSIEVVELIRYSHIFYPDRDHVNMAADDVLLVKGSASDLLELLSLKEVAPAPEINGIQFNSTDQDVVILELIIVPQSSLLGERLLDSRLRRDPDIHVIAIQRSGLHYTEKKIHDVKLKIGDVLLIRCPQHKLDRLRGESDFIVVEDVHHEIVHKRKAPLAFGIFAAMVVTATSGLADILISALAAVFLMVITGCLQIRGAYRAMQGSVLMLIVGTIALGAAMEKTGTSQVYAEAFLGLFRGTPPIWVLCGILFLTSISTQILSNNATAILILPIAISTALKLGVDPKPFIIAVCFGASACFATPIGYQTNLLVYGPGGYRFSDYLKLGIPLNLIVLLMGAGLIPLIWSF